MSYGPPEPHVIYLQYPTAACCVCGEETVSRWGIPVDSETGEIVANDFQGDWGGKPACFPCWESHAFRNAFVGDYPKY